MTGMPSPMMGEVDLSPRIRSCCSLGSKVEFTACRQPGRACALGWAGRPCDVSFLRPGKHCCARIYGSEPTVLDSPLLALEAFSSSE